MMQAMEEAGQDVDEALQLFQQQRHKEILALHSLDLAVSTRYGEAAEHALQISQTPGIPCSCQVQNPWHTRMTLCADSVLPGGQLICRCG